MRKNCTFLKRALRVLLCFALIVGLFACIRPEAKALSEGDVIWISGTYSATLSPGSTGTDFYNFIKTKSNNIWNQSPHYMEEGSYILKDKTTTYEPEIKVDLQDCTGAEFTDGTYYVYLKTHNNLAGDSRIYFYHRFTVTVQVRYTIGYSASGAPSGYGGIKVNGGNASNSGSLTVVPNGSVKFEVVSVPGHKAEVDTGGATYSQSGNTYTYSNVGQNFNFKVTYTPTDYATVTFTQPEGATITVNGSTTSPVQVISGISYNVSVTAATGYQLTGVKFDGASQTVTNDTTSSFTFTAGESGTTHTVSATTLKHTITVEDTATFYFNRGMSSSQIVTGLFNTIYKGSTLKDYTASDVNVNSDDGKALNLQYWGENSVDSYSWINLREITSMSWTKPVHSIGGLQMQFRLSNGTITSNACTVTLIDDSISANGTISKPYTGEAVSLSMTNGEDFTWTTHSGYASSSLAVYQCYDSSENVISAPSAVGSYYVRLRLTENYDPFALGAVGETSYSDYIPFSITKATLNSITIPDTIVPVVGGAPVSSISVVGYIGGVTWNPSVSTFAYDSQYTATVTLKFDSNCEIEANAAVNVPAGTVSHEVTTQTTDQIVVELTFKTAKEKIISVSATDTTLGQHYADADDVIAVLPATVTVTTESGTVEMPVTWSFNGTYSTAPKAVNSFTWTIEGDAYENYDTDGVSMTGTANVTNAEALSVTNTPKNVVTTYTADFSYNVTQLFTLDTNAGTPTYTLVTGGTGEGALDTENKLTITKAGTFQIQVTTDAKGIYAAGGAVTATLTVNKGTQAALTITGQPGTVTYGDVFALSTEGGTTGGTVTWTVTSGSDFATVNASTGEVTVTGVGDVTITATMAGNDLYDVVSSSCTFTPAKKVVTISGTTIEDKVYDGKTTATVENSGTVSGEGIVDALGVQVVSANFENADAAEGKTVYLSFALTGNNAGCYEIDTANSGMTATATISPLDISTGAVVGNFEALTYNGEKQTPVASVTKNGLPVIGEWSKVTDVADKTTFTADGNFTGTIGDQEDGMVPLNIAGAEITLGKALTYNGEEQRQTVTKVMVGELEVTTYEITGNMGTDAGSYTLTVTGDTNFTGTAAKDFTIAPKPVTITAKNQSYRIGTELPETIEVNKHYTIEGLVEGDSLGTITVKYQKDGEDVTPDVGQTGTYDIIPVVPYSDANYDITLVNGKLTYYYVSIITPAYPPVVDGGNDDEEIDATCSRDRTCPMYGYTDLDETEWYHDGVHFCIEHGLMQSVGNNQFDPGGTTTRAMIVTILWRLEGSPVVNYAMDFEAVDADQWYTEAIRWATSEKIVEGYGGGKFGADDAVTREQMVTIMFRYAKYKGYDVSVGGNTSILSYGDAFDVAEWAIPAMQWACGESMIQGIDDGNKMNLAPQGSSTRAQAAAILQRFIENVVNEK